MVTPHGAPPFRNQVDLFTSLLCAAHWVWDRRRTAKLARFPFSEETVTETILLDLATQNPLEIQIVPFNKYQEAKTGADWEWCFYDQSKTQFARMIIQAKVLDDKDHEYAHFDRKIGNTGIRQIDRLLSTANARGVPALYVFYNHLSDPNRVPLDVCHCHGCLDRRPIRSLKSSAESLVHGRMWIPHYVRCDITERATFPLPAPRMLIDRPRIDSKATLDGLLYHPEKREF